MMRLFDDVAATAVVVRRFFLPVRDGGGCGSHFQTLQIATVHFFWVTKVRIKTGIRGVDGNKFLLCDTFWSMNHNI